MIWTLLFVTPDRNISQSIKSRTVRPSWSSWLVLLNVRNVVKKSGRSRFQDLTWVGGHLVGDEDGHVVLLGDLLQLGHHLGQALLSLSQLPTAGEIHPEERHDAVHDQQLKDPGLLVELGTDEVQELPLLLAGVGPAVQDVVQHGLLVQVEPVRDGLQSVRSEGVLGAVSVELPRAGADPENVPPVDGVLESRSEAVGLAPSVSQHLQVCLPVSVGGGWFNSICRVRLGGDLDS